MAQPAGFSVQDNRTDMAIPIFWASANLDTPWQFKVWLEQFLMAITVKENINPENMLEDSKELLEEPQPIPVLNTCSYSLSDLNTFLYSLS